MGLNLSLDWFLNTVFYAGGRLETMLARKQKFGGFSLILSLSNSKEPTCVLLPYIEGISPW